jgi:hypothetical protein
MKPEQTNTNSKVTELQIDMVKRDMTIALLKNQLRGHHIEPARFAVFTKAAFSVKIFLP